MTNTDDVLKELNELRRAPMISLKKSMNSDGKREFLQDVRWVPTKNCCGPDMTLKMHESQTTPQGIDRFPTKMNTIQKDRSEFQQTSMKSAGNSNNSLANKGVPEVFPESLMKPCNP